MKEYFSPQIPHSPALEYLLNKIGISIGEKRIVLTPYLPVDYSHFALQIIERIDNAVLVVFGNIPEPYSIKEQVLGFIKPSHSFTGIATPDYDRNVRHLSQLSARELDLLIEISDIIAIPEVHIDIQYQKDFLLKCLLQAKVILAASPSAHYCELLGDQRSILINKTDKDNWINYIKELLTFREDTHDLGAMAKSKTLDYLERQQLKTVYPQTNLALAEVTF